MSNGRDSELRTNIRTVIWQLVQRSESAKRLANVSAPMRLKHEAYVEVLELLEQALGRD